MDNSTDAAGDNLYFNGSFFGVRRPYIKAQMQLELILGPARLPTAGPALEWLAIRGRRLQLMLVPNRRARRYVLRLCSDGVARVTIPRSGSAAEARRFVQRSFSWLEKQLWRQAMAPPTSRAWMPGTEILFRGQPARLEISLDGGSSRLRFGGQKLAVNDPAADLRPEVERYLWQLATRELPPRVLELATLHQLPVRRVSVRSQRSRWGSCSRHGTLCLNWRLVQAPEYVRDYIILHELAHLKEMNHSRRFWQEVARLCPDFAQAETWLKKHSQLLR